MNVHIIGRHMEVGYSLREFVNRTIDDFKKFNLNVISTNVILRKEKKLFFIEMIFNIKGKHTIVINEKDKDIYAAIDKAIPKASKALRRLSNKIKNKQNNASIRDLELEIEEVILEKEPELIQKTLKYQKPMTIEEAIDELNNSDRLFIVFNDNVGVMRTMYKRNDANLGIY